MILTFLLGVESGGFQISLLHMAREFNLSEASSGAVVTVQFLAIVLMPVLLGGIVDKLGKKKIIIASTLFLVAGCAALIAAKTWAAIACAVFVIGAGFSSSESFMMAALADCNPQKASQYINLSQCTFSVGCVVSPIMIDAILKSSGWTWRVAFIISGCSLLLLVPLLMYTGFKTVASQQSDEGKPLWSSYLVPLRKKVFLMALSALLCYVGLEAGFAYFTNSFFAVKLGAPHLGAYALSAFWLTMSASRLIFGLIKIDPRKATVVSMLLAAAAYTALAATGSPYLGLALCVAIGAIMGPAWPMLVSIGIRVCGGQSGVACGILLSCGGLGGAIVPFVMGIAADNMGLTASIVILAVLAGVTTLLAFKIPNKNIDLND